MVHTMAGTSTPIVGRLLNNIADLRGIDGYNFNRTCEHLSGGKIIWEWMSFEVFFMFFSKKHTLRWVLTPKTVKNRTNYKTADSTWKSPMLTVSYQF